MSGSTGMAKTPYAWLILFVTCLAHCFWNIAIIQPGGLSQFFFDPSAAYVYTPMEFSMVMTVPFLTTGLFGLVFGVWADKQSLAIATDVGAVLGAIGLIARLFLCRWRISSRVFVELSYGVRPCWPERQCI